MNNRDKLQKFSIRKYAIGTFSTVIATLVFIGFNSGQAHANELNQATSVVKKHVTNGEDYDSNTNQQQSNPEVDQTEDEIKTLSENNTELSSVEQKSRSGSDEIRRSVEEDAKNSLTNYPNDKNNLKVQTNAVKSLEDDKEEQKDNLTEKSIINKRSTKEDSTHKQVEDPNKLKFVQPPLDKTRLQALYDASYHNYRIIDKDQADKDEYNKVKATFDKINDFLGNSENPESKKLALMYHELEQAIELTRTLPQRTLAKNSSSRMVRSTGSDRSRSQYLNANTEYYVSQNDDGSSYSAGTFLHASNKGAPFRLPSTPYNILRASSVQNIAYITSKRVKDGYEWDVLFNLGHSNHENMIYWFAIPRDQTPTGPVTFSILNKNGTGSSFSGFGGGSGAPLPQMWTSLNNKVPVTAREFKHGPASNYNFYQMNGVSVRSFFDFARGSNEFDRNSYFHRDGATSTAKYYGDENYAFLNGQRPQEGLGLDSIYSFIGKGDVSYRISFKTTGSVTNRLYYAAGGRAQEFRQLFNFNQLTVEPKGEYLKRVASISEVKSRTVHLGHTQTVADPVNHRTKVQYILDGDGSGVKDYMDDPISYVKNISNSIMGFYPPEAPYNQERWQGINALNTYQIDELFTRDKLENAARTGNPIRLMIGFDAEDAHHNPETLVPVNLYVKPQLRQNIELFHDNEGKNRKDFTVSHQAGHPVFQVMSGTLHNTMDSSSNLPYKQEIRIKLTSNEPIKDNDWAITGYPHTLNIQEAVGRTNNSLEKNLVLVGDISSGNFFVTVRLGDKKEQFEIRAKPNSPRILTTEAELRGNTSRRPTIRVTDLPNDSTAKIKLVMGGEDGDHDPEISPYTIPENYTVVAETIFDNDPTSNGVVTFKPDDYKQDLPLSGVLKAIVYYNDNVLSNFSNSVSYSSDTIAPTINEPAGLNHKYYRGNHVEITLPVTDNQGGSGIRSIDVNLPSGWRKEVYINPNNHSEGTVKLIGDISNSQPFNTTFHFNISATDNAGNVTHPEKNFILNVGKLADDFAPSGFSIGNLKLVVNPKSLDDNEREKIKSALRDENSGILRYLSSVNPIHVGVNGDATFYYKDGSVDVIDAEEIITYAPEKNSIYSENGNNNKKEAVVTIARGQNYTIRPDMRKYFSLSNGSNIPTAGFTTITALDSLPNASQISRLNIGTYSYRLSAKHAYNKVSEDLILKLKIIDVTSPTDNNRVYRISTYDLTDEEINNIKQAFKASNPDLNLNDNDISVTNTFDHHRVNNVRVTIRKGDLIKDFSSNLNNMNFLRWINLRDDYNIYWSSNKIQGRVTDAGLEWSPDHKSIIYKYDATQGRVINTNEVLNLLRATAKHSNIRTNLFGEEKLLAERSANGYSKTGIRNDGEKSYLLNSKPIQVLDLVDPVNGYGARNVSHSNIVYNERNSSIVNGEIPSANGAAKFNLNKVVKANSSNNGVMGAVYQSQLYLAPYSAKSYIERLGQNLRTTNNVINIYFVPTDPVRPNLTINNYNNHIIYSGETFKNTINVSDNYGIETVATTNDSTITMTRINNELTGQAPNVTRTTNKLIKVKAIDKSGNEVTSTFDVIIKPLNEKYNVTTSSTIQSPLRIDNIQNNASLSTQDINKIKASIHLTKVKGTRNYVIENNNDVRQQTISNVIRNGNNATVRVTTTFTDGSTNQISIPVKHVIHEVIASPKSTVRGQQFPSGKGSSPNDFFKLRNGDPVDARIVWKNNQGPDINSNHVGTDITLHADIYFDGETTPVTKDTTYKLSQSMPKQVYETYLHGTFNSAGDSLAGNFVQPVNRYWPEHMNFSWAQGSSAPNSNNVGSFIRTVKVIYENGQSENVNVLFKVKPNKPIIDNSSVIAKGGLSGQQIIVRNVPTNAQITLYNNENVIPNTNSIISKNGIATVTVAGTLPVGNLTAKTFVTNHVTYSKLNENNVVTNVTENVIISSDSSEQSTVTAAMQVKNGGIKFIKGTAYNFNEFNNFISNIPANSRLTWAINPNNWKNNLGQSNKVVNVQLPNNQGLRTIEIPVFIYPNATAKTPDRDRKGHNLTKGIEI